MLLGVFGKVDVSMGPLKNVFDIGDFMKCDVRCGKVTPTVAMFNNRCSISKNLKEIGTIFSKSDCIREYFVY